MEGPHKKFGDPGFQEYKKMLQDYLVSQGRDPKAWSQISYGYRNKEVLSQRRKERRVHLTDEQRDRVKQRVRQRLCLPEVKEQKRRYAKQRYHQAHPDVNVRSDVALAPALETCRALLEELRIPRRPRKAA